MQARDRQAMQTRRDYCRGCSASTLHPFAGWATPNGRENSIRPRAYYRTCAGCGLLVLVLADVSDAEGIARAVLDETLRPLGGRATATSSPVGPPPTDWDSALNYLFDTVWRLYGEKWNPMRGVTFRAYATGTGRQRLSSWIRDESGDASERSKGRVYPKAHAPSVSASLEGLIDAARAAAVAGGADDHGGLDAALGFRTRDFADDRSPDLARALTARGRGHSRDR